MVSNALSLIEMLIGPYTPLTTDVIVNDVLTPVVIQGIAGINFQWIAAAFLVVVTVFFIFKFSYVALISAIGGKVYTKL